MYRVEHKHWLLTPPPPFYFVLVVPLNTKVKILSHNQQFSEQYIIHALFKDVVCILWKKKRSDKGMAGTDAN